MRVLYAASEAAPFFKTGGLGDVAYSLPQELKKDPDLDIRVVLPYYSQMPEIYRSKVQELSHFRFQLGFRNVYCGIKSLELKGLTYYFIDNLAYFDRAGLYGEWDDGERFAFFATAIIEMLEVIDWIPDIIHVNDWQTAMIPALLVDRYHWKASLRNIRKVLTIHNLRFQGIYPAEILPNVFGTGYNIFTEDGAKFGDHLSFLKAGINFSDRVTTVSPTYAKEVLTPAFGEGLDPVLRYNQWKLSGIINGIDMEVNNPSTDPSIPFNYDHRNLDGKRKNKAIFQKEMGLSQDLSKPLIGMVTRLTDQKGLQLVERMLEDLFTDQVQLVVLGTGDPRFEDSLRFFQVRYPDKMRACIQFDVALAQKIYAASDIFLMPSAFEPCGLSQMIAMRYGTLPLVHETGGLKDTVVPYNQYNGVGNGFSFHGYNHETLLHTLWFAIHTYRHRVQDWRLMMNRGMTADWSWANPAAQYKDLYQSLLNQ